jgi:type III secretory pathway component EscV
VSQLLQFLCVLTLLYGFVNAYRVPYFAAAALCVVALHQVLAPEKQKEQQEQSGQQQQVESRKGKRIACIGLLETWS